MMRNLQEAFNVHSNTYIYIYPTLITINIRIFIFFYIYFLINTGNSLYTFQQPT